MIGGPEDRLLQGLSKSPKLHVLPFLDRQMASPGLPGC